MPRYAQPTALPIALDHGEIYLQSIVQDPPSLASSSTSCRGLAILAHPLGRLGGSLDDPVITHLASLLLTHAHLRVVRFNSRGVGKSGGSASWTGKSECSDFQELLSKCIDNFCLDFPDSSAAQLIIAGYSAGALYASTVTVTPAVYDLRQFRGANQPRYILLSFPAGVTWALSFFTTKTYTDALKRLLTSTRIPGATPTAAATEDEGEAKAAARAAESTPSNDGASLPVASHVLAIYGDQDQFTGVGTYETWTSECSSLAPSPLKTAGYRGSTFYHVLIENADHFYRSRRAFDALDKAIVEWYDALTD
ncbi:hypothetical protein EX895_000109 [Sporisorium graminicola]|uniref:AB hydrolase-1 domain-containing protein n=1 Tax=Sporisorium graminicola TaxID=280036 RepID=A0A4U7KZ03_9BASI|nr:hypothetical protein EX895_000109 [Sporisorium graminicola]TKY90111.1 hypothetical protein EX895_000109 [Sporisorium graminicola]